MIDQEGGFEKVPIGYAGDIGATVDKDTLWLNTIVTGIDFDLVVSGTDKKVKVDTNDGCLYSERVVVTVPAATLNGGGSDHNIKFQGPTNFGPIGDLSNMNPMEEGQYNKFFCKFNANFWGDDAAEFLVALR